MVTTLNDLASDPSLVNYIAHQSVLRSTTEPNFFNSGFVPVRPELAELAKGIGTSFNLPSFNALSGGNSLSSDDVSDVLTLNDLSSVREVGYKAFKNAGWSFSNFAVDRANSIESASDIVAAQIGTYWTEVYQKDMSDIVTGIVADNVDNDSGDMVTDIAISTGTVTGANRFSVDAFTSAQAQLGDRSFDITGSNAVLVVHSKVYQTILNNDVIDFIPNSDGTATVPTYRGTMVVVSDNVPVDASGDNPIYTSVLFAPGSFSFIPLAVTNPIEFDRNPLQGNGSGVDALISRVGYILHPTGFAQTSPAADGGATPTELKADTSWSRVYQRKQVPMAFIQTNA